jgi:hypothetical protein
MKIINSVVIGVSVAVIFFSMSFNWYINDKYYNGSNDYSKRPPLKNWYVWIMWFVVFASETVLAASVEKTLMEYSQFVSENSRAASQAWQFGQIIPFMMLIQPIMEAIRALLPKIELKRNERKAAKQDSEEIQGEDGNVSVDRNSSKRDSQNRDEGVEKDVGITTSTEIHEVV